MNLEFVLLQKSYCTDIERFAVMKKYIIGLLVFASPTLFACSTCDCNGLLDIIIKNNTSSDCYIIQQTVTKGMGWPGRDSAFKIIAGQTNIPYSFFGGEKNISLTVPCGDDKFATFLSASFKDAQSHEDAITGSVVSLSNIDAIYTTTAATCTNLVGVHKPSAINWTLE